MDAAYQTSAEARTRPARRLLRLRARLRQLYRGHTPASVRFRLWIIVIDLMMIGFFIASPFIRETPAFLVLDYVIALALALDLIARALSWRSVRAWSARPIVWVDLFVLATLLAPLWFFNLAFLRVLRLWTLFHSEVFWETVGRRYAQSRWRNTVEAASTLATFIFIVTGFVYAIFAGHAAGVDDYLDALYFTVATLSTTGFGDIVLPGALGQVVSIITMIAGITLFVRLGQTLFRPNKVEFGCPTCGLLRHDPDAVHCKACGTLINIPNDAG